jgi:hypothetical protein
MLTTLKPILLFLLILVGLWLINRGNRGRQAPLRRDMRSPADAFLGEPAYRPMLLTVLCALLLAFGSCYGALSTLGGGSNTFLNGLYGWCFVLSLWAIPGAAAWALVTWIRRRRSSKED